MIRSASRRACLVLSLSLPGCGAETGSTDGSSTGSTGSTSSTDEDPTGSTGGSSTGPTPSQWPRRITLVTSLEGAGTPGVRFADGTLLTTGGDVFLTLAMVLSLRGSMDSVCAKGTFAALADIPTDLAACPAALSGAWSDYAYLDASSLHTQEESHAIGLGLLVWDEPHTTLYRLRVVGDSYDQQGQATVSFDYEPAPASP